MATNPARKREVKSTTCYMCACRCGIHVTVEDGEVRFIQGNPAHPINKGAANMRDTHSNMRDTHS